MTLNEKKITSVAIVHIFMVQSSFVFNLNIWRSDFRLIFYGTISFVFNWNIWRSDFRFKNLTKRRFFCRWQRGRVTRFRILFPLHLIRRFRFLQKLRRGVVVHQPKSWMIRGSIGSWIDLKQNKTRLPTVYDIWLKKTIQLQLGFCLFRLWVIADRSAEIDLKRKKPGFPWENQQKIFKNWLRWCFNASPEGGVAVFESGEPVNSRHSLLNHCPMTTSCPATY